MKAKYSSQKPHNHHDSSNHIHEHDHGDGHIHTHEHHHDHPHNHEHDLEGISKENGQIIILAFLLETLIAFSPVAPLFAFCFIIAEVAIAFVPSAYISILEGSSSLRA